MRGSKQKDAAMPTDSKQDDARLGYGRHVLPVPQPIIMAASPYTLVYLAQVGALYTLHAVGHAVLVTDLTVIEAIRAANAQGAFLLDRWVQEGSLPGCPAPVTMEATELGQAVELALKVDPALVLRTGAEAATIGWLSERLDDLEGPVIVLHAGGRVPRILAGQRWGDRVTGMGLGEFLNAAAPRATVPAPRGKAKDAERLEDFASLARQETATAGSADLAWLLRLAGYGDTAECRALPADRRERVTWPGERVQLYVVRARERLPGGQALWGGPNLRPINDWWRLDR